MVHWYQHSMVPVDKISCDFQISTLFLLKYNVYLNTSEAQTPDPMMEQIPQFHTVGIQLVRENSYSLFDLIKSTAFLYCGQVIEIIFYSPSLLFPNSIWLEY